MPLARGCTTGWPPWSTLGWSCLDCSSGYVQGKTAQSSSPPPLFDRIGCPFCAMALQKPLGFETQQPPTLVAPPLITGRDNAWLIVSHGNAILPFVVSRPKDDSGEASGAASPRLRALMSEEYTPTGVTWPSKGPSSPMLGLWQGRLALRSPGCYLTAPPKRTLCIPWRSWALAGCQK